MMTEGRDEDEWRNGLISSEVSHFALIDVCQPSRFGCRSSVLTSTFWEDRKLGFPKSGSPTVRVDRHGQQSLSQISRRAVRRASCETGSPLARGNCHFRRKPSGWMADNPRGYRWAASRSSGLGCQQEVACPQSPTLGMYENWASDRRDSLSFQRPRFWAISALWGQRLRGRNSGVLQHGGRSIGNTGQRGGSLGDRIVSDSTLPLGDRVNGSTNPSETPRAASRSALPARRDGSLRSHRRADPVRLNSG
jgi:hypothetical protein